MPLRVALGLLWLLPFPSIAQPDIQLGLETMQSVSDLYHLVPTDQADQEGVRTFWDRMDLMSDLYQQQTEALERGHDEAAGELLDEVAAHVSDEFYFLYGQELNDAESYALAELSLHRYLELVGESGPRYHAALELLHEVSDAMEAERHLLAAHANAERLGFRDCRGCPLMVEVPKGTYTMGSPATETMRDDDEGPQHVVTIDYRLAVGVYEVTFAEWDACVRDGGCERYSPYHENWGRADRPVINVSWDDAKAYVAWLSGETGETYRLLSEAEWEYVARAGTSTPFNTGETISTGDANYNSAIRGRTTPVGSFSPNRYGLHDLHGNVQEWVEDCWNDRYRRAPRDGSAWTRGECDRRVLRGGSWFVMPWHVRAAARSSAERWFRYFTNGFRVARTLPDTSR